VTMTAGWEKVFAADPRLGFLAHARVVSDALAAGKLPAGVTSVAAAQRLVFNDWLDAIMALVFMIVVVLVLVTSISEWLLVLSRRKPARLHETEFVRSALAAGD